MPDSPEAKALKEIKGSIDGLRKSVDQLGKAEEKARALARKAGAAPSIDTLNSSEIEELRKLAEHAADVERFSAERLKDPLLDGMYRGFHDMGLINCVGTYDGSLVCVYVSPKAAWVVERHDLAKTERGVRERRELVRYLASIIVPSAVSLAAVLLAWMLAG